MNLGRFNPQSCLKGVYFWEPKENLDAEIDNSLRLYKWNAVRVFFGAIVYYSHH